MDAVAPAVPMCAMRELLRRAVQARVVLPQVRGESEERKMILIIAFVIGIILGTSFGAIIAAVMFISRDRKDKEIEEQRKSAQERHDSLRREIDRKRSDYGL